jgi:AcrR family transcriptional regulator
MFLDRGFEQTTLDAIAEAIGMTKRTIYARYEDKAALFKAAVMRAVERFTVPLETLEAADTGDLETTLLTVARIRVARIMTPNGTRLQRILSAQAYRFPELFNAAFEQGTGPAIRFLSDLFARHSASGEIDVTEPERAAPAFLSLVVGGPTRIIVSGNVLKPEELEARIRFAVRLFLNGVRRR